MFRPSLLRICATTMSKLCPTSVMHAKGLDGKPVFADVEHCLMSKVSQIQVMTLCASHQRTHPRDERQDPMCKVEVTRIQVQMENDFRLDPEVSDALHILLALPSGRPPPPIALCCHHYQPSCHKPRLRWPFYGCAGQRCVWLGCAEVLPTCGDWRRPGARLPPRTPQAALESVSRERVSDHRGRSHPKLPELYTSLTAFKNAKPIFTIRALLDRWLWAT